MTKIQTTLLVLFVASTALAAPKQHHRHHRPSGSRTGHGKPPSSTSGPYGYGNSTAVGPTGTGTGAIWPTGYSTYVVSPLPVSSNEAAETTSETCDATVTVTSSNTVTVTMGAESSTAAATALSSGPVESVAPSAFSTSVGYGNDTSSAGPLGPTGIYSTEYPTGTADASSGSYPYKHVSRHKWTSVIVSPSSSSQTTSTSVPVVVASSSSSKAYTSSSSTTVKMASSSSSAAYTPSSSSVKLSTSSAAAVVASSSSIAYTPLSSRAVSSTSAAAVAVSSTATSVDHSAGLSGAKRGLAYVNLPWLAPFANAVAPISWVYNWASIATGLSSNYKFVPMLHDLRDDWYTVAQFIANIPPMISKIDAIMAFNEPDQTFANGGSQLTPSVAADAYKKYISPYKVSNPNIQLGAPSVCNGNTTTPTLLGMQWLAPFFESCAGCPIDFVPLHWYGWSDGSADQQADVFIKYITTAAAEIAVMAKRPMRIWVTEFAAMPLTDAIKNEAFMNITLPWLDNVATMVDRYSYYMVDTNMMVNSAHNALTASGTLYAGN